MRFLQTTLIILALGVTASALAGPLDRAEKFRPDVYPCKITASEGAARRVVDALNGSMKFTEAGSTIVVDENGRGMCEQATGAIAQVLQEHFGEAKILVGQRPPAGSVDPKKLVTIETGATEEQQSDVDEAGNKTTRVKGVVTLTVSGGGVDRAFATRYLDKCWAADFKGFLADHPKQRFVLGQSTQLASTESEALSAARKDAAKEIWDPLRTELNARNMGRPDKVMVSEELVRRQVESLLKQGKCVEDTFVQRLDGPNGTVYQASILVNFSRASVDEMVKHVGLAARQSVAQTKARRVEQARGWGSVAAFFAVIVLLYLLVNSLTKGYFMWRLRAAALLLCIVGILVALAVT